MANQARPVFLQLTKIRFPITAITSILHRITGVILFLSLPMWLFFLEKSVDSDAGFLVLQRDLKNPGWQLLVWIGLSAALYHLFAGIRHIIMDMGYGETKSSGRLGAYVLVIAAIIAVILAGIWIW